MMTICIICKRLNRFFFRLTQSGGKRKDLKGTDIYSTTEGNKTELHILKNPEYITCCKLLVQLDLEIVFSSLFCLPQPLIACLFSFYIIYVNFKSH